MSRPGAMTLTLIVGLTLAPAVLAYGEGTGAAGPVSHASAAAHATKTAEKLAKAQKLRRALAACKKDGSKAQRKSCEAQAKRRDGAKHSKKTTKPAETEHRHARDRAHARNAGSRRRRRHQGRRNDRCRRRRRGKRTRRTSARGHGRRAHDGGSGSRQEAVRRTVRGLPRHHGYGRRRRPESQRHAASPLGHRGHRTAHQARRPDALLRQGTVLPGEGTARRLRDGRDHPRR